MDLSKAFASPSNQSSLPSTTPGPSIYKTFYMKTGLFPCLWRTLSVPIFSWGYESKKFSITRSCPICAQYEQNTNILDYSLTTVARYFGLVELNGKRGMVMLTEKEVNSVWLILSRTGNWEYKVFKISQIDNLSLLPIEEKDTKLIAEITDAEKLINAILQLRFLPFERISSGDIRFGLLKCNDVEVPFFVAYFHKVETLPIITDKIIDLYNRFGISINSLKKISESVESISWE